MWTVIKTEKQYDTATKRMEELWDAKPGSKEDDELEILLLLLGDYEDKNYPIPEPDPIEAIKFRMEQMNYSRSDLMRITGQSKTAISLVMNKKRSISLALARTLYHDLHVPAEILLGEPLAVYTLKKKRK